VKGKNRATFTIHNTGTTNATFNLLQTYKLSGPGMAVPAGDPSGPAGHAPPLVRLITSLGGRDITSAIEKGHATVTLAPGAAAKVVTRASLRINLPVRRDLRLKLQTISQTAPIIRTGSSVKLTLTP
jgi:hypothetical protein